MATHKPSEYLTYAENLAIRRRFAASLSSMDTIAVYWRSSARAIACRKPDSRARKSHRPGWIPSDAVYVGTYAHPFPCGDFLGDLNATLIRLAASGAL